MNERLKILSRNGEPFIDRIEAGNLLGKVLFPFKGRNTVVLGIPRGGLVVARQVAGALEATFDIVLARKLGAPDDAELAVGSVNENGHVFLKASAKPLEKKYLDKEKEKQSAEISRQWSIYRKLCPKTDLKNKTVIVVDDGVATGSTAQAAIEGVRQESPHRLIAAFPVGPQSTLLGLCKISDEVFCLKTPAALTSVGRFYIHFEPVAEADVLSILKDVGGASHDSQPTNPGNPR